MIRKKWIDGEPVLSVETEDEFWKALTTSEAVELTWELGEKIGLMEDDTISVAEAEAARNGSERLENGGPGSSPNPPDALYILSSNSLAPIKDTGRRYTQILKTAASGPKSGEEPGRSQSACPDPDRT